MRGGQARADLVLWVGISFQQSASVEHFRRARRMLKEAGRGDAVPQLVVSPTAGDAVWNLVSAIANAAELELRPVKATADEFLKAMADHAERAAAAAPAEAPAPVEEAEEAGKAAREAAPAAEELTVYIYRRITSMRQALSYAMALLVLLAATAPAAAEVEEEASFS